METRQLGYGIYEVRLQEAGAVFTGTGLTESEAWYRARLQAEGVDCSGCERRISQAVAAVSRIALGAPFCAGCRARLRGGGYYDVRDGER